MTTVQIELPEQLAREAHSAGLLSPRKMEALLRAQLRREAVAELRAMHARAPAETLTPEVEQEILQVVEEGRARHRKPPAR